MLYLRLVRIVIIRLSRLVYIEMCWLNSISMVN